MSLDDSTPFDQRLPVPRSPDQRRAGRLPRLRQHLAEAAPGHRRDDDVHGDARTRRSTAAPTGWPPRRPTPTSTHAPRSPGSSTHRQPDEVIFTKNATESLNLVAAAWGRANLRAGDVVVLTHMEHHANIVPWHMLAAERGIELRWVPLTPDGLLDLTDLDELLDGAKAFAFTAMSNVLGTLPPVATLCKAAHDAGAIAIVDACQYVPHNVTDVTAWDADFVAFCEPQDVRAVRHRRAVGEDGAARRDAAIPRRRQHDRRRAPRRLHRRAGARQVRGRHSADHRSDRPGRGGRVPRGARHGQRPPPRDGGHAVRDVDAPRAVR